MYHSTPVAADIAQARDVTCVQADLGKPQTLPAALQGVDVVVHFAGVLFAPRPERFLPVTNVEWFSHLLAASLDAHVGRVILISFPHVEGPTSVEHPATGRLDRHPVSVHAQTRLEEERLLIERTRGTATTPVVLRLGMVYGRGMRMIEAARWLARRRLLYVWREATLMQLISIADYLRATEAAIVKPGVHGIYHVGDEQPITLQQLLDELCGIWGYGRPMRLPMWTFYAAASLCEWFALVAGTRSPLTRDFVRIGGVSHWGDTTRARQELIPQLTYPTLTSALSTL